MTPPDAESAAAAARAARAECHRRLPTPMRPAAHFLSPAKRDAACAAAAFCHMVREAIDEPDDGLAGGHGLRHHPVVAPGPSGGAAANCCAGGGIDERVALLRERIAQIYAGGVELPAPASRSGAQHALHAFALVVRRYEIPRGYLLDLVEGWRRDRAVTRYPTWAALQAHCDQVAGNVALIVGCILGLTHPDARDHAVLLGRAMRLTAILRDVGRDRDRGRVYLPLEDMARFRYSERDLSRGVVNDPLRALMRFEIARARDLYRRGAEGLCWVAGESSRLAAAAVVLTQASVLDAIERRGGDAFAEPVRVGHAQLLRRLPHVWRLARRRPDEPMPRVFPGA